MAEGFANNYVTSLTGSITTSSMSLPVASVTGAPSGNFRVLVDNEIMLVTVNGSNLDVVTRAIEGPGGVSGHSSGASVEGVVTVASMQLFVQKYVGFSYTQSSPSATWTIVHNLGRNPDVTVIDSSGSEIEGDVSYTNINQVVVSFTAAFSGTAELR